MALNNESLEHLPATFYFTHFPFVFFPCLLLEDDAFDEMSMLDPHEAVGEVGLGWKISNKLQSEIHTVIARLLGHIHTVMVRLLGHNCTKSNFVVGTYFRGHDILGFLVTR
ncbi:unnamed protein product [Lupinus luteus]|uniref:Uncharacterized protein n=1 Tax=Lupinus luteus TaxID=3873 RepID=A0AAV1XQD0_LUPLU